MGLLTAGYGYTASAAALEAMDLSIAVALHVKGSSLKGLASITGSSAIILRVGDNGSGATTDVLRLLGKQGASGATHVQLSASFRGGGVIRTGPELAISGLSDDDFYTIWVHSDQSPLGVSDSTGATIIYKDDGTEAYSYTYGGASSVLGGTGKGVVQLGGSKTGTLKSNLIVDGLAIYSRAIAPGDRPMGTPPGTSDPYLSALWYFDEGSGTTATDEVNGIVMTLAGSPAWSAGGSWPSAVPIVATRIDITTQPADAATVGGSPVTVVAKAKDGAGNVQNDYATGSWELVADTAPTGWDVNTVFGTDTPVAGQAALTAVLPMAGDWTFKVQEADALLTTSAASTLVTASLPSGGGGTTLSAGLPEMPILKGGSANSRTLPFWADTAGLDAKPFISINGGTPSQTPAVANATNPGAGNTYLVQIADGSIAAGDLVVVTSMPGATQAMSAAGIVTLTDVSLAAATTGDTATAVATAVLVTPANKLATDASGRTTVASIIAGAISEATFDSRIGKFWKRMLNKREVVGTIPGREMVVYEADNVTEAFRDDLGGTGSLSITSITP